MSTELVISEELYLQEGSKSIEDIKRNLAVIAEQYAVVPEDLSVKENYAHVTKGVSLLRTFRTSLDKQRKKLNEDDQARIKFRNSVTAELIGISSAIEDPLITAKKDYDTAVELAKREAILREEARIEAINERIATIRASVSNHVGQGSEVIAREIDKLNKSREDITWAQEFSAKAVEVLDASLAQLGEILALKIGQEQAAKEKAEREAEEKRLAEIERVKREAEADAERRRLKAEREQLEAEKAKLKAEQDALATAKLKAEQEVKLPEVPLSPAVEAILPPLDDGIGGNSAITSSTDSEAFSKRQATGAAIYTITLNRETAKLLLSAIIKGDIPNVTYN